MQLAKEGYGSYNEIQKLDIRSFMDLIHYENYLNKYGKLVRDLNKK